jgi:hypothetical protein
LPSGSAGAGKTCPACNADRLAEEQLVHNKMIPQSAATRPDRSAGKITTDHQGPEKSLRRSAGGVFGGIRGGGPGCGA